MDNEQTLELQILSKSEEALKSLDKLVSKLTEVEKTVNDVDKTINNGTLKTEITNVEDFREKIDKATESTNRLVKSLSFGGTYLGIKKITKQLLGWMNEAVDQTEQLNLFNVVFENIEKNGAMMYSNLGREATKFQYKLNEVFGTNKTQTFYMQGIFQSMGENVGIPDLYSAIMSESMTKLTYDLASLYNKNENTTAEALRAGVYAGQTKPLRSYGIDVTQNSMQPILRTLGINDISVKDLSQAEKEILRYLATLEQAKEAMGDLANTIESPSNQLKVFRQQLVETKVAISSLFIDTFSQILPYANAFLMTIKEIAKAIADLFGIDLKDYNTGIASNENVYIDLEESIDNATNSVKELKKQTLGFDQIHNINEKNNNGNGFIDDGIDQRLLDAIKGYDNGMDKVRMKATQIRDNIMEWLGFIKNIDLLTGEVNFKLKDGYSNLKLIGGIVATLVGFKLFTSLKNLAKGILGVDDLLNLSGKNLTTIGKLIKSLKVSGWSATITKIITKLKTALPILGKVTVGIGGIAGVIFGSTGAYNGMKNLTTSTENTTKELGKMVLGIGEATAGGALLGSIIPGVGTVIGALSGAIVGLTASLIGYNAGIKELAEDNVFGAINISTANWTEMLNNLNVSINDNTVRFKQMSDTLLNLGTSFDENASKLDFYGLKFGTLAQKITDEDSVNINNAIKNMCDNANEIIDTTTTYNLELWGSTFKRMTTITEEEEKNILNSILNYGNNQKEELKKAQDSITTTYENAIETRGYLTDEEYKYISEQLAKIRELTNKEMSISQTDIEYYKTLFADRNQKLDEQSYANYKEALNNYHKERLVAIEETYNQELNSAKNLYEKGVLDSKEYNQLITTAYQQRNNDIKELDEELKKYTDNVISSLKSQYGRLLNDNSKLGKEQKKIIENIFKDLNIDVSVVKKQFEDVGKKCAVNFSNGLSNNLIVNGSTLYSSWNSTLSKFDSAFNNNSLGLSNPFQSLKVYGKANGGAYYGKQWHNISQFANGGVPSYGSLFVAGERGAEIVGNINGRTEVLNQSQIASAIYNAVLSAMSKFNGQTTQVDVVVHSDGSVIVDEINQRTKQTGVCPIYIPS